MVVAAGCTSASIESSWRAPSAPQLTNVVTLSPASDAVTRRSVEDRLAQQLSKHGVHAVPAYTVLTDAERADVANVGQTLHTHGFDGIVAMRLVGAHQKLEYYPGFDGYWGGAWGTMVPETIVKIEVSAYALPNKQLVWSALSKSVDPGSEHEVIADVTKVTTERMAKENVIGAPQATMR